MSSLISSGSISVRVGVLRVMVWLSRVQNVLRSSSCSATDSGLECLSWVSVVLRLLIWQVLSWSLVASGVSCVGCGGG